MKYFLLSLITAAADLGTKEAVKKKMPTGHKKHLGGRLYLWHIKNKGLAYNSLEGKRNTVLAASSAAVGIVGAYLLYLVHISARPADKIGPALILGGGLGNLIERLKNKEVTDFLYIDFKKAPIFNLADITAVTGGIITVIRAFVSK